MHKTLAILSLPLALLSMSACEPAEPTQNSAAGKYASALPNDKILVNMPVNGGARTVGATAESYTQTVQATTDINGLISYVLTTIDTITEFDPTYSEDDDKFFWGPWSDGGLDPNQSGLYVEATGEDQYAWALIQRPRESTSDDDWVALIAGEGTPGADEDAVSGFFVIDFDAIASMNAAENGTGTFVSTYDIRADGVVDAEAAYHEFNPDAADPLRISAGYRYSQDIAGAGHMDLAYEADVIHGGENEVYVLRTRWLADGQGRGDVVLTGGEIAPLVYQAHECWDTNSNVVYEENNYEMLMDGDASLCAFDQPDWNDDAPQQ